MLPYIRYLLSLVILLMMLSPLIPLLSAAGELLGIPYRDLMESDAVSAGRVYEETAVEYARLRCEDGIRRWLCAKTGIPEDVLSVVLQLNAGDPSAVVITKADVTVYGKQYGILSDKMTTFCEELLGCPCEIAVRKESESGAGGEISWDP